MKNVRIMYKKAGDARFVSHLDMNRYFARILRKSDIPVWFTEGFNPHIYTNFAFPLSLGFESQGEILDIRLIEDYPLAQIKEKLNAISPENFHIIDVWKPIKKFTDISFAEYRIAVESEKADLFDSLNKFLQSDEIIVTRTNKKGVEKQINLADEIKNIRIEKTAGGAEFYIVLPAGNAKTINPSLLIVAFADSYTCELDIKFTRIGFLDGEMERFM